MELGLAGKVAIVTGAARGLGRAIAQALAGEGVRLAVVDIAEEACQQTAKDLQSRTPTLAIQADVSDEDQVTALVRQVVDVYARVDILVNNAGIASFVGLPDIPGDEWDRVLAVNLKSVLLMSQAVFPIMQAQESGAIVNMSSMAGKVGGLKIGAAYSASKAGINCLTIALARTGAPYRIRVNALAPAFIESAMMPAERSDELVPLIPIRRMGKPEDVADAVLFLASDRASFITGEILDLNGGALMD